MGGISPASLYAPGTPAMGSVGASTLGVDIVANRPRGGYASAEYLRGVLAPEAFETVAPYLTVARRAVTILVPDGGVATDLEKNAAFWKQALHATEGHYEFHALVDFNRAPVDVLRALLRNISASGDFGLFRENGVDWLM